MPPSPAGNMTRRAPCRLFHPRVSSSTARGPSLEGGERTSIGGERDVLKNHDLACRAASFQVQAGTSAADKRRHTVVLQPSASLPSMTQQAIQGYVFPCKILLRIKGNYNSFCVPRRPASPEELEAARWREEVVKLMLTAQGHQEIQKGLDRFRQRGMPSLATCPQPGLPTLITCSLPRACSCGPCLRAERQSKNSKPLEVR
jgi:hypothetical protein